QRRFFEKAVIGSQAEGSSFDVGGPVEGVHQKAEGALIEGDGHGVDRKVAAAQVFLDGGMMKDRLARFGVIHAMGTDDIDPDGAGKTQVEAAGGLIFAPQFAAELLQWFL